MRWIKSPNYWPGRYGYSVSGIVIHTAEGSAMGTDRWFSQKKSRVSAHYLVTKEGSIHQYVKENDTAWHAGRVVRPTWNLLKLKINPNLYTIGIEFEGKTPEPFTALQYEAGAALVAKIARLHKIPLNRAHVIKHNEIRATKTCPGNRVIMDLLILLAQTSTKRL